MKQTRWLSEFSSLSEYTRLYPTQNKFGISYKHGCIFFIGGKIETYKHLAQPLFLVTKTWKYGGCVFDTVLPAKSDSDDMFCLQSNQGLVIEKSLCINLIRYDRINTRVIYRFALAQVVCISYV